MTKEITINHPLHIDHIARIEGKAGITVKISDRKVTEVKVNIVEGPRFFEAITVGKHVEDAVAVFPRICSFCAAAHKITAVQCAENAIGLEPSDQTKKLREILYLGDQIESHALHLFLLALPDFLGYHDVVSMSKDYMGAVKVALSLKDIGADIQSIIGSRYIHQESLLMGGFGKLPKRSELKKLEERLKKLQRDSELAVELFAKFNHWPEVTAERQHLAIKPYDEEKCCYGVLGDTVAASDRSKFPVNEYRQHIEERVVPHSFAKHSYYKDKMFMTGAISRFVLFGRNMVGRGKEIAYANRKNLAPNNPFSNNFAQAIELVYFVERARWMIEDLLRNYKRQEGRIKPEFGKAGIGFSASEAPRGLVFYNLEVDEAGIVKAADLITPTALFMPLMEEDVRRAAKEFVARGMTKADELSKKLETVVRSYDPCVSCSVHVTKVK